jgi:hypothetical protein
MTQTLYIVTYPAGTGTPSDAQIVAGQDSTGAAASWAGNAIRTGSVQYLDVSGLDPDTEYDSAAVIYDGTFYSNVVEVSGTWTTLGIRARPSSDIAAGSWTPSTGSDLYAMLDEVSVDDADYITTSATGQTARLALTPLSDPGNDNNHVLRYRASSPEGDLGVIARVVQYGNQGIITSKQPWRNQPLSLVEVDWANPLTKNMVFAYLPGLRKDLTGRAGIGEVRGTGTIASPTGLYTTGTINDSGLRIHNTLPLLGGRYQSTVIAVAKTSAGLLNAVGTEGDGLISNSGNAIYCERGATGSAIYKLGALYWPTGPALRSEFTCRSDANVLTQVFQTDATINNGRYHFFAGVRNGGTVSSRVNNLTASSAYGGGTDFSNVQRRINSDAGDLTSIWNGTTSLCAGWHRSLSTGELDELYKNPWQIFKAKKLVSYFGGSFVVVATRTHTLTTSFADYRISLSNAEAATITDYDKLHVEFESL